MMHMIVLSLVVGLLRRMGTPNDNFYICATGLCR